MPAPTTPPYRERLLESVATALRTISQASGYFHNVKTGSVVLDPNVNILNVPITELPYMTVEPTPSGSRFFMPANLLKHIFQVLITARMDAVGIAHNRKMQAWERLYHDIEKALVVDITRGGLAIDTRIDEPQPVADIGPSNLVLVIVPVNLTYIRTYGAP